MALRTSRTPRLIFKAYQFFEPMDKSTVIEVLGGAIQWETVSGDQEPFWGFWLWLYPGPIAIKDGDWLIESDPYSMLHPIEKLNSTELNTKYAHQIVAQGMPL